LADEMYEINGRVFVLNGKRYLWRKQLEW
jgi:hypothetical protein